MKEYGKCPRKAEARRVTVFDAYRRVTGSDCVPASRQYWTLCGPMADGKGGLQGTCELLAAVKDGVVKSRQFIGVERDHRLHLANMNAILKKFSSKDRPRVVIGDMAEALRAALSEGTLKPGLVNLDTINEPGPGATLLSKCLNVLRHVDGPIVVVWNTILQYRWRRFTWEQVRELFAAHPSLPASLEGWEHPEEKVWTYRGTGKSSATMGTVVLVRRARAEPLPKVRIAS